MNSSRIMELISCQAGVASLPHYFLFRIHSLNTELLRVYCGQGNRQRSPLMDLKVAKEINVKNIEVKHVHSSTLYCEGGSI